MIRVVAVVVVVLLVIIAVAVVRNSASHRSAVTKRDARGEALRERQRTENAQVYESITAMQRMAAEKDAREKRTKAQATRSAGRSGCTGPLG